MPNNDSNPVITEKKYLIGLQVYIDIYDVEKIVNYVDQGWTLHELDTYHSAEIRATTEIEVETDFIERYIKALKTCPLIEVLYHEEIKAK